MPTRLLPISVTTMRVLLVCSAARHRQARPQIDDRNQLAAQIDDAFHEVRRARHVRDFDHADDFLHLGDVDAVLFVAQAKRYDLQQLAGKLLLLGVARSFRFVERHVQHRLNPRVFGARDAAAGIGFGNERMNVDNERYRTVA